MCDLIPESGNIPHKFIELCLTIQQVPTMIEFGFRQFELLKGNIQMILNKRLLALLASIASLVGMTPTASAAGTANFNVTATLNSACTMAAFSGPLAFGAVTAFVAPAAPTAVTSTISCTRTLAGVTAAFDTVAGSTVGLTPGSAPTGTGVLSNGLEYSITGALGALGGGTAATSSSIGTADTGTFTVNGAMVAQAGTCAGASCGPATQVRTVTLNF